ncbi:hypothetical protein [Niveibacterium terrae]|uniref:hypothetical protein n=1 Tax=Niveibacterium terrae TaxID=3373598 RepID=UPI003A8C98DE
MIRQLNAQGKCIGEDHPRAVLTDHEVELIRSMHEDEGFGYGRLAALFGVSKTCIQGVCIYRRRAQTVERWKEVHEVAHA